MNKVGRIAFDKPVLALDTSTAAFAAAVVRDGKLLADARSLAERNHSVLAVPLLKEALEAAGVRSDELGGIAVGHGPGSYTGVRIAVSIAKTLAWAWQLPVAAVSSLEALALGGYRAGAEDAGPERMGEWVVPLMDARRGQVYTALFGAEDGGLKRLTDDGIRLMRDWTEELAARAAAMSPMPRVIRFTGDPALHLDAIAGMKEALAGRIDIVTAEAGMDGRWVAELGIRRLAAGDADETHTLVPNYTQLAEAEAKLLAQRQEG